MGKHFRLAVIAAIGVVSLFPASGYESKAGGLNHAVANSRLLDGYVLSRGPVRLNGISGNASGLTYNPESGTLFLIQNKPENIYELDKNGNILRKIKLPGFDDTEGIDHIGGNRFVLVEEYRGTVVVASIDAKSDFVDYGKSPKMNVVRKSGNKGFEGVTYVPGLRKLILAKEKFPARLEVLNGVDGGDQGGGEFFRKFSPDILKMSDLSDVQFDRLTGNFLVLSDEGKKLVEISSDGEMLSQLDLSGGLFSYFTGIRHPEGIAIDDEGRIYICGEPNLLYIFSPGYEGIGI